MHMNLARATFVVALLAVVGVGSYAMAGRGTNNVKDRLRVTRRSPAISSNASGNFEARIDDAGSIAWALSYENLTGSVTPGPHPLRADRRQRWHLDLVLLESPVAAGRRRAMPEPVRITERHRDCSQRARSERSGDRRRRLRRDRRGDSRRQGVRERPLDHVPGRRDPRPAEQRVGRRLGHRTGATASRSSRPSRAARSRRGRRRPRGRRRRRGGRT